MNPRGQDGNHLPYDFPEMERYCTIVFLPLFRWVHHDLSVRILSSGITIRQTPVLFTPPHPPRRLHHLTRVHSMRLMRLLRSLENAPASSTSSPQQQVRAHSPTWTSVEEEVLICLYKENAEPMRKQGKKGQVIWRTICEQLIAKCKDLGIQSACTWQKCEEKFFNLSKKYKQVKDQLRVSVRGSDPIGECEHFQAFNEFMWSRDAVLPKHVMELHPSTPVTPPPETAGNDNSTAADEEPEVVADPVTGNVQKGKQAVVERARGRKKQRRQAEESEDQWLTLFREQNEMLIVS